MRLPHATRRGIAATEFALWLPVMLALIAGVIDWGAYMNARSGVTRAAIDGARVGASKFESTTDPQGSICEPAAEGRAKQVLDNLGLACDTAPGGGCTITADFCLRGDPGPCDVMDLGGGGMLRPPVDSLRVGVRYDFQPWFGHAFTPDFIAVDFVMAMENQRPIPGGGGEDD